MTIIGRHVLEEKIASSIVNNQENIFIPRIYCFKCIILLTDSYTRIYSYFIKLEQDNKTAKRSTGSIKLQGTSLRPAVKAGRFEPLGCNILRPTINNVKISSRGSNKPV